MTPPLLFILHLTLRFHKRSLLLVSFNFRNDNTELLVHYDASPMPTFILLKYTSTLCPKFFSTSRTSPTFNSFTSPSVIDVFPSFTPSSIEISETVSICALLVSFRFLQILLIPLMTQEILHASYGSSYSKTFK